MNELEKTTRQALDALKEADRGPSQAFWIGRAIAALEDALAQQQAEPVHGLVSDREYLRLFEDARNGSDRASGVLRGIRAVIAAYEAATPKQAEPVAWPKKRKPRAAEITESDEHYARSEGYDEGWNDCLAACMKQQAEPVQAGCKTETDCTSIPWSGPDLMPVLRAIEEGASFDVLEKLAADYRKGLK
jgi:hypothetical protein